MTRRTAPLAPNPGHSFAGPRTPALHSALPHPVPPPHTLAATPPPSPSSPSPRTSPAGCKSSEDLRGMRPPPSPPPFTPYSVPSASGKSSENLRGDGNLRQLPLQLAAPRPLLPPRRPHLVPDPLPLLRWFTPPCTPPLAVNHERACWNETTPPCPHFSPTPARAASPRDPADHLSVDNSRR